MNPRLRYPESRYGHAEALWKNERKAGLSPALLCILLFRLIGHIVILWVFSISNFMRNLIDDQNAENRDIDANPGVFRNSHITVIATDKNYAGYKKNA